MPIYRSFEYVPSTVRDCFISFNLVTAHLYEIVVHVYSYNFYRYYSRLIHGHLYE